MLSAAQLSGSESLQGLLPHLLGAVQFLEAMRNFVSVICPSQRFYATFAWSVFLGISIILIIFANGISVWKDTILASVNWIKGMLLKISGTQSLLPWYPGEFHGT